jgi:hypothetical protein
LYFLGHLWVFGFGHYGHHNSLTGKSKSAPSKFQNQSEENTPNLAHCQVVPVSQTHVRARVINKEYA